MARVLHCWRGRVVVVYLRNTLSGMVLRRLEWDIRPGSGVGIFELGSSLWSVLNLLRDDKTSFPQVEVKWDHDSPANTPIILHVRPHLDLLFSPLHQRLSMISVRQLHISPSLALRYKDQVISSWSSEETDAHVVLHKKDVSKIFGPTYLGETMRYPGLWFSFEEDGEEHAEPAELARGSPDRMLEVRRVVVVQNTEGAERSTLDEMAECEAMAGSLVRAIIRVSLLRPACGER